MMYDCTKNLHEPKYLPHDEKWSCARCLQPLDMNQRYNWTARDNNPSNVYDKLDVFKAPITATIVHSNGGRAIYKDSTYPVRIVYGNGEAIDLFAPDHDKTVLVYGIYTEWWFKLWNRCVRWILWCVIKPTQVFVIDVVGAVLSWIMFGGKR